MYKTIHLFQSIPIGGFQLFLGIGIELSILLLFIDCQFHIPHKKVIIFHALFVVIGITVGGKLLSALSLCLINNKGFVYNLLHSGNVFYGGLLGGLGTLRLLCLKDRQLFVRLTDTFAAVLPLGHAIGRIGCYCNGCCYGQVWEGFLSVPYILNGETVRVFPTWFIEAACDIILFLIIRIFFMKSPTGIRTALYFSIYPIYRFIIEFFRGDEIRGFLFHLSTSQWISLIVVIFGIRLLIRSRKNYEGMRFGHEESCGNSQIV